MGDSDFAETESLRHRIEDLKAERKMIEEHLGRARSDILKLSAELGALMKENSELRKERDGLRIDIAGLIDESRSLEQIIKESGPRMDKLTAENAKMCIESDSLRKRIAELRFEVDDLKRTIIKLNREKCTAEERIEDKTSQRLREYEFRIQNQLGQITAYEFVIKEMFGNGESDM